MWGQVWGHMVWGGSALVPATSFFATSVLTLLLVAVGMRRVKFRAPPSRWALWSIGVVACVAPVLASAAPLTLPFVFSNGTLADAIQVNQNFSAVTAGVTDDRARLDRLETEYATVIESEWRPRNTDTTTSTFGFGQGGAYINNAGDTTMVAPTHVPSHGRITRVEFSIQDSDATANLRLCLYSLGFPTGAYFSFGCVTSSGNAGIQEVDLNLTNAPPGPAYQLRVLSVDNTGGVINWPGSTLQLRTARVQYHVE